jgi:hypothetical protein
MQGETAAADISTYAFKASLVGAAHRFELTKAGLAWQLAGRSAVWPYAEISAITLSYRPVWMQAHRFRADIRHESGARLSVLSTSWQTAALMAAQDDLYRAFIRDLHARLAAAGSRAKLSGGLGRISYAAAVALAGLVGVMLMILFVRALVTGEYAGALFFVGFAALFGWQIGGFIWRNRPVAYSWDRLPAVLLP